MGNYYFTAKPLFCKHFKQQVNKRERKLQLAVQVSSYTRLTALQYPNSLSFMHHLTKAIIFISKFLVVYASSNEGHHLPKTVVSCPAFPGSLLLMTPFNLSTEHGPSWGSNRTVHKQSPYGKWAIADFDLTVVWRGAPRGKICFLTNTSVLYRNCRLTASFVAKLKTGSA